MVAATRIADDGNGGVAITFDTDAPDDVLRDVAAAVATQETTLITWVEAFIARRASAMSPSQSSSSIAAVWSKVSPSIFR